MNYPINRRGAALLFVAATLLPITQFARAQVSGNIPTSGSYTDKAGNVFAFSRGSVTVTNSGKMVGMFMLAPNGRVTTIGVPGATVGPEDLEKAIKAYQGGPASSPPPEQSAGTPTPQGGPVFTQGPGQNSYSVAFPNGVIVDVTKDGNLITARNLPSIAAASKTGSSAQQVVQMMAAQGIDVNKGGSKPAFSMEYASGKKTVLESLQAGAAGHDKASRQAAPIGGGWRSAGMETRDGNPSGNRAFVQENGLTQRELVPSMIHEFSVEAFAAMQIAEQHGVNIVGKTAMEMLSHERYVGGQAGSDNNGFHENK